MKKKYDRFYIFLIDFITINLAWIIYYFFRVESGMFSMVIKPTFLLPMLVIYLYWLLIFFAVGMYKPWFADSRFEEISTLFKTTFIGVFVLFSLIFFDDVGRPGVTNSRYLIIIYWGILLSIVGFGRLLYRAIQRYLLVSGIGRHNTLIIGYNKKSKEILNSIKKNRPLGLDVVGFIAVDYKNVGKEYNGVRVLSQLEEIERHILEGNVKEIIISLDEKNQDNLLTVISKCDSLGVVIKVVPDLFQMLTGQVKSASVYGVPLIEINPKLLTDFEKKIKRLMDIFISLFLLTITSPIIILTALAIKLESHGPIIYKQERVGLKGRKFTVLKFRSMIQDAEKNIGAVWASKIDSRITKVGNFIRKVRIDEIPQMYNVLKGEMSLVGPRPERPIFVEQFAKEIPFYKRRLLVKPGLTGWAQVKHKYDEDIEDVKNKLNYDLFYIENISIRMDLKILFRTVFVVLLGKGHFEK